MAKPSGCSETIVGESIRLSGSPTSFPGARWRGRLHCPPEVLEAAGLRWQYRGQQMLIEDGNREYTADCHNLQGHSLVEMLPVLEFFGLTQLVQ